MKTIIQLLKSISLVAIFLLAFSSISQAHTTRIAACDNGDGTYTFYAMSYSHGSCYINNSGMNINGNTYPFTGNFSPNEFPEGCVYDYENCYGASFACGASVTVALEPGNYTINTYDNNGQIWDPWPSGWTPCHYFPNFEATCADTDGDGVCDDDDNCPDDANADQADLDGDGVGDVCDPDIDGDGLPNYCDRLPLIDNKAWDAENPYIDPSWECGNNNNKVLLCHVPIDNPANAHTICVSANAIPDHLGDHDGEGQAGDYLGECTCMSENLVGPGSNGITATAHAEQLSLEVFPNPANDKVNIHLHALEASASLTIYDHLGRIVLSQQLDEGQDVLQLDLTNGTFQNGIYIVTVISQGERMTKRLVITKR